MGSKFQLPTIFNRSYGTDARSIIGYWYDNVVCQSVRLSVCLSVTLCIVAEQSIILRQKCLKIDIK